MLKTQFAPTHNEQQVFMSLYWWPGAR
jgi:hypothetical protein